MSEMVERVARAMCTEADEKWDARHFNETAAGNDPEDVREYWLLMARTAVAAMREPTEQMVEAGTSANRAHDWVLSLGAIYTAMIDAETTSS